MPSPDQLKPPAAQRPYLDLTIDLPPADLRKKVAQLIAQGLYQARLPWLPGEKIVAGELEGVANFVIGGILGLQRGGGDGQAN